MAFRVVLLEGGWGQRATEGGTRPSKSLPKAQESPYLPAFTLRKGVSAVSALLYLRNALIHKGCRND